MAFDFNSVKNLPSGRRNAKIIAHQIRCYSTFYQLGERLNEAKERGNKLLAIYYIFLERLFKATAPHYLDEVPEHLKDMLYEPDNLVAGMETMLQQYRAYGVEDADKLNDALNFMKFIQEKNPHFFDK